MKKFKFAHLIGEGIGEDFEKAQDELIKGFKGIDFEVIKIKEFRLPNGELDPKVAQLIKEVGVGMKGPTRTEEGVGAQSANVALRKILNLYQNVRPIHWFPGIKTPVTNPELLNVVIFRQNTEDIYMGIENEAGSEKMEKLFQFLTKEWDIPADQLPKNSETGGGIKLISKPETERIMRAGIEYALKEGRKKLVVVHKGNIMKYTEGAFKTWALEFAKANFRDQVYCKGEESLFSDDQKANRIFIDTVITDDCLSQLLIKPWRFEVIVTMNLNGDYLSDAAAAQVGGVPTSAGGNIGDDCAVFEAIGGTADDIAGQNKANPTAYLLAFAMMLDYRGLRDEANAIKESIAHLFKNQIGTADMKFESRPLSTIEFAKKVAEGVEKLLALKDA